MLRNHLLVKVATAFLTLAPLAMGAAGGCGGPVKSGGDGATAQAPAPAAPSVVASADGAPPPSLYSGTTGGADCQFSSVSTTPGTGLDLVEVGGVLRLKAEVAVTCDPVPSQFHMYLEVWFLPYLGTAWTTRTGTSYHLPPVLRKPFPMTFSCKPGVYFIDMQANGVSSKGIHFKAGAQTDMAQVTAANCAGH